MVDGMRPERWNLLRAALYGGLLGVGVTIFQIVTKGMPYTWAFTLGQIAGGAIGGAILFGLVAGLRNLVLRAR